MIGSPTASPDCGLSGSLHLGNKRQSTSQEKIRNAQKLDTAVDKNFPDDKDSASVFGNVIGRELFHGSSNGLYLRCRMNFSSHIIQTEAPQFVDLGLPAVNTSNKFGILGTLATRIRMLEDGSHWSAPDHVFGEATAVIMSVARSDQDYSYKLILRFGGKINHLWTRLVLVQTRPM